MMLWTAVCGLAFAVEAHAGPVAITIRERDDLSFVNDDVTIQVLDCNRTPVVFRDSAGNNVLSVTTNAGTYTLTVLPIRLCTGNKVCALSLQRAGAASPVYVDNIKGDSATQLNVHVVLPPVTVGEVFDPCRCVPVECCCVKPSHCGPRRLFFFCRR